MGPRADRWLTMTVLSGQKAAKGAAQSGPLGLQRVLRYPGVALQVVLENVQDVETALGQALRGWHPEPAPAPGPGLRRSVVRPGQGGFSSTSSYLDETLDGLGAAGAACAVIADLAQDYFETRPGSLALHCGAFRFNDRLIAVTGPSRAGKSTLAARLTQEPDIQVFCDDVLPLDDDNCATGLGIAPRLRLPLPRGCSPGFKRHVARHLGPRDDRYGYLCAPTVAPHGTRAPLSVLLILDRRDRAAACLHHVADDEALHFLLSQNMSDLDTAEAAFVRLSALMAGITCLRLVYADLEDAVALIRQAFAAPSGISPDVEIHGALPGAARSALPVARHSPDQKWARDPDVVLQARSGGAFLWLPGKQVIWHMNALALAIWTLLEIPGSATELAEVLSDHFPGQDIGTLVRDINALLQVLADQQMIEPDGRSAPA